LILVQKILTNKQYGYLGEDKWSAQKLEEVLREEVERREERTIQ
jgi:hypothetical protein